MDRLPACLSSRLCGSLSGCRLRATARTNGSSGEISKTDPACCRMGPLGRVPARYLRKLLAAAERDATGTARPATDLPEVLSERELEVLQLIAAGKSNRRIAEDLFVSVGTVKTHINNLYRKLDAHSRTQAVARARELKLL